MQDLKSLISCGIGRFFILIFAGRKEHRTGSKMHLKSKKSRSENFRRIERALENTGFSRVPLANDSNFDRNPLRGCNYGSEGGAVLDLRGCNHSFRGCNTFLCCPSITVQVQESVIFRGSCRRLHGCPSATHRESWRRAFPHFRPGLPVHSTNI